MFSNFFAELPTTKMCFWFFIGNVLLLFLRRTIDSLTACLAISR